LGILSQAGPKMSLILVTPLLVGAADSAPTVAAALAGAEAWRSVAGSCELLLHAPTVAATTVMAPTAASRWIFLNSISTPHRRRPVRPGRTGISFAIRDTEPQH
jgi:hypothetical protein